MQMLTTPLPEPLLARVDALATRLERPSAWIVEQALARWVEREEAHHAMTLEALDEADAGRLVEHADVVKWADSLATDRPLAPPTA